MKYPVGIQAFDKIRQDGYVYVDKTDLVYKLATEGTVYFLIRLLNSCKMNISDYLGKYFRASEFENYRADVQSPLPMLYQSGYLTIKDYNPRQRRYLLGHRHH